MGKESGTLFKACFKGRKACRAVVLFFAGHIAVFPAELAMVCAILQACGSFALFPIGIEFSEEFTPFLLQQAEGCGEAFLLLGEALPGVFESAFVLLVEEAGRFEFCTAFA